jgi:branched-chain amino acid transport system permease protein
MSGYLILEQVLNGVQFGMLLFLMAVGVTLVFGVMDVVNLSHGSLYMMGGFFLAQSILWVDHFYLGALIAGIGVVGFSILIEVLVIRPLYSRGHLDQVLATFGLILFFNELVVMVWGRAPLFISTPPELSGQIELIPGAPYPTYRLAVTAVSVVLGIAVYAILRWTRIGMLVRAGAEKRQMVELMGVNIAVLYTAVFAFGAFLAAVAGMAAAPLVSVETGVGEPVLILTLVVVIIGGIGSVKGALVASLVVGLVDTFGRVLLPELIGPGTGNALANMSVYILMAGILYFRPRGLFGEA